MPNDGAERLLPEDTSSIYYKICFISALVMLLASFFGAVLNVFHLIVLTRKPMRTSSVNSMMVGIAVCDLICTHVILVLSVLSASPWGSDCDRPYSINRMYFNLIYETIYNGSRQCSAWLGLMVALTRYLIVSNVSNQSGRASTTTYGARICLRVLLMSLLFSVVYFIKYHFVQNGEWTPKTTCEEYSAEIKEPIWRMQYHWMLEENNGLLERVQHFFVGLLGKLIPCVMLPGITVLLLREMKQSEQRSPGIFRFSRKSQKDRTTILVIFVAITFMASEFPIGVTEMVQVIIHDFVRLQNGIMATTYVCEAVFLCNASIHCLIHFAMSSQYRKTAVNMIPCSKRFKNQVIVTDAARSGSLVM